MALSWKFVIYAALLTAIATAQSPPLEDNLLVDMPEIIDETADYYFPTDYDYSYDYDYGDPAPTIGETVNTAQAPVVAPIPAPVVAPAVDAAPVPEPAPSAGFKAHSLCAISGAIVTVTAFLL